MSKPWYQKLFSRASQHTLKSTKAKAEAGDTNAQFGLGLKYANSEGAAQDYVQAAGWYLKAAEQNHSLAQFNLAMMYSKGQGVPRDDAAAVMWIRRAADLGDAGAQFDLGVRYQRTSLDRLLPDTTPSKIEAYKWLNLAAAQGYLGSAAACERVTLTMTREDVTDGNQRVAAFVAERDQRSIAQ